ncbi:MAG: TIGR00730 family Rossman fold protein [Oscillospiraceae bacterium]|nr:TIGR00730 family Rossman fold protein [Oscillospiraceae bacterium]
MKICVYGASARELDAAYFEAARELGVCIAEAGHSLVFGGGARGLMGACAEGCASRGGEILGIAPRFFDEPGILFERCTRFLFTETMAERKTAMAENSDAFIALPGGIGTFEEFFETLTLKQLGRHTKPMALLDTKGYYRPLTALLERAADEGFLGRSCFSFFALCVSPTDALRSVENAPRICGNIERLEDYGK